MGFLQWEGRNKTGNAVLPVVLIGFLPTALLSGGEAAEELGVFIKETVDVKSDGATYISSQVGLQNYGLSAETLLIPHCSPTAAVDLPKSHPLAL